MKRNENAQCSNDSRHSDPVRVCFLIDELTHGGTELRLIRLVEALDRKRVSPFVCTLRTSEDSRSRMSTLTCPTLDLSLKSLRAPTAMLKLANLVRFLRRNRIDVLALYFRDSTVVGILAGKLARTPAIVGSAFNTGYWMNSFDRYFSHIYRRTVNATIANCQAALEAAIDNLHIRRDTVTVLENGIDLSRFQSISPYSRDTPAGTRFRVGMVANLRDVKDPGNLIRAAAILKQQRSDIHFVIAGEGSLRSPLEESIKQAGLGKVFELAGEVVDIPAFLRELDVAVLTSLSEGMSNSIIEYMAAGRPIVVTDVGGTSELIEHERTGLLVPPKSPRALADAVERLLADGPLSEELALEARRASRQFTVRSMAKRYEDFYINTNLLSRTSKEFQEL